MKKITQKVELLKKEIEVKDKLIGSLLHVVAENKIKLPQYILKIIDGLYNTDLTTKHTHVAYDKNVKH